jgi:hypothetical protein
LRLTGCWLRSQVKRAVVRRGNDNAWGNVDVDGPSPCPLVMSGRQQPLTKPSSSSRMTGRMAKAIRLGEEVPKYLPGTITTSPDRTSSALCTLVLVFPSNNKWSYPVTADSSSFLFSISPQSTKHFFNKSSPTTPTISYGQTNMIGGPNAG